MLVRQTSILLAGLTVGLAITIGAASATCGEPSKDGPTQEQVRELLQMVVGDWTEEGRGMPGGTKSTSASTTRWVLNGRFIQTNTYAGPDRQESMRLVTYDEEKGKYRLWVFGPSTIASEFDGDWDEATKTMRWKGSEGDRVATITCRMIDKDTWSIHSVFRDKAGKVVHERHGKNARSISSVRPTELAAGAAVLRRAIREYKLHVRSGSLPRVAPIRATKLIQGRVIAAGGFPQLGLIVINVGQHRGVRRGHSFTMYRSGQRIGEALASEVFPDISVAHYQRQAVRGKVEIGDRVATRPEAEHQTMQDVFPRP